MLASSTKVMPYKVLHEMRLLELLVAGIMAAPNAGCGMNLCISMSPLTWTSSPALLAHTFVERQQLAYPVRFAQRPQTLEDRQGTRQKGMCLRYVALLL